jgi:methionine aminopeptidase
MFSDPIDQLKDPANRTKYQIAGQIVTKVMNTLVSNTKPGSKLYDLATLANKALTTELDNLKYPSKGIAYPTCVNVNEVVGNFVPPPTCTQTLNSGDMVKYELGVHIDGFPAILAYTVVVGTPNPEQLSVLKAVHDASRSVFQNMTTGTPSFALSKMLKECATTHGCTLPQVPDAPSIFHAPGVVWYEMSRNVVDGFIDDTDPYVHRFIVPNDQEKYDLGMLDTPLEDLEVYCVDIVMCSDTGKLSALPENTTIYKKVYGRREPLKLKAAHEALNLFKDTYFPKTVQDASTKTKLGLKECINKGLVEPYHPYKCHAKEHCARAKFTVLVGPKPELICGRSLEAQLSNA